MERNAYALAELIGGLRSPDGRPIEVVIGMRGDGGYDWSELRRRVAASTGDISIRPLKWERRSGEAGRAMFPGLVPDDIETIGLPSDGVHDFLDCDAWVMFSNAYEGFVPARRPLAVYVADLVHRYVPLPARHLTPALVGSNQDTFLYWRSARCVFSTSPGTVYDNISFAGVPARQVRLTPYLIDPVAGVKPIKPRPAGDYILWVTNTSPHKNHAKALEALKIYWTQLGGGLDVVICGSYTETLKPGSGGSHDLTVGLEKGEGWAHRVRFAGHVDDEAFVDLVAGSAFVWHNVITDNGTFVVVDAARAGRLFVSSDYPTQRYMAERYGLDSLWFPASDPAAAAQTLIEAERKVRAGYKPNVRLKPDDPAERASAYQGLVDLLLQP